MKSFIIAEAGANHNRDFDQACRLIDVAKKSGSDAVKFQTYSSETMYSSKTPDFAGYKNIPDLIKSIELPRAWQKELKLYCDDIGIEFMSTPFDCKAVDELFDIGVKRLKIAGFESTDPRIVKYAASTGLPLIITAGIGVNLETMHEILGWVREKNPNPDVTFLHGNNAYPTPFEDINLGQISRIKKEVFDVPIRVGISDHTEGILVPPAAVSLGAEVVEKHFTIDRSLPGPDHPFAIEPDELEAMVRNIRTIEVALGKSEKSQFTKSESKFKKACRSVIALKDIKKGDVISEENITTKRPFVDDSIPAKSFYKVLGSRAVRDVSIDSIMTPEDISYE